MWIIGKWKEVDLEHNYGMRKSCNKFDVENVAEFKFQIEFQKWNSALILHQINIGFLKKHAQYF